MYNKLIYLIYLKLFNIKSIFKYKKNLKVSKLTKKFLPYLGVLYFKLLFKNNKKLIFVKNLQFQFLSIWCFSLNSGTDLIVKNLYNYFTVGAEYYI